MKKLTIVLVLSFGILAITANAQAFLTGQVTNPAGPGVNHAHILFYTCLFPDAGGPTCIPTAYSATTNPFGYFNYSFPVWAGGAYIVQATAKQYDPYSQLVIMNDDVFLHIVMQPVQ